MRILVVDDNELVRRGIRAFLSTETEFSVCGEAADGAEAVEKAKAYRPDAVLMDVCMPGMDGLAATRILRRELPHTKVILVSQNDPAILNGQAAEVGAHGSIAKSNLSRDLMATIEKACDSQTNGRFGKQQRQRSTGSLSVPWLAGGGEMGALMLATDWSATPLGPPDTWSSALRMMVQFLLANRFPQLLWWGPQFCSLYNDAYVPILGAKHPWAIGRPVAEVWSEIWHILKPLVEAPYNGGAATWMEDIPLEINRRGFVEETHFTIAYSPVPDETVSSGIGGVLATVHEITEKVIGERRLAALRDLGARSVEPKSAEEACTIAVETLGRHSKDVPFVMLYLVDEKRERASLAGSAGVDRNDRGRLNSIDLAPGPAPKSEIDLWPLSAMFEAEEIQLVQTLTDKFENVPRGPWADPPNSAALVPIRSHSAHHLAGFMIVGISSRARFDEPYRNFLELLSTQIATTIAKARADEEERERAAALAEIDRAKTAFFSNVSHEFRTPLTLMLGPLQDLLSRSQTHLSPTAKEHLELVNRNGARLLRLVNTLLDFSRIEAGRVQAVYQATDLAAFTAELASTFRSATDRAGLELRVDCPPFGELAYVDRDMWEKIILNLLSNAFKFTFEGEIAVTLAKVEGAAELRVRDTGVGIPAEAMPQLFERFHRIPNTRSRTYEGSGIGLALVQELVKLHGGTIRAESVLGQGTAFVVTIPLGQDHLASAQMGGARSLSSTAVGATPFVEEALRWLPDASSDQQEISSTAEELLPVPCPPVSTSGPVFRPRVIVADDNSDMRQYLARLLAEHYQVEAVSDGQEALAAARERAPDLILSDVMMPQLDGLALLRELRADPVLNEVPIVLLSARAGEESRLEGIASGADDYLVKPFSARELMARVEGHVKMHRMRQEAKENLEEQVLARTRELEQRNADITKQAEEVRTLSARLLQLRDDERRHLARELHDSLGQELTVTKITLDAAARQTKLRECRATIADAAESLGRILQQTRSISYLLHPPTLDQSGLRSALGWLIEGVGKRSGIKTSLQLDPGDFPRLKPELEMSVFRIVQEALSNVLRHSQASKASVLVVKRGGELTVTVRDDGRGLAAGVVELRPGRIGVGISGMRQRISELGGELRLRPGNPGTVVEAIISLDEAASAAQAS